MTDENLAEGTPPEEIPPEGEPENTGLAPEGGEQPPEDPPEGEELKPAPADVGKSRTTKYIKKLNTRARNAERENEQLRSRLDTIEERLGEPPEPVRPTRDDYDTDEEYEDKLFDWRDKVKASSVEKPAEAETKIPPIVKEFETELDELDPEATLMVMENDWPCSEDMTDYIMASENRAALAFHLATNEDISEKISKMSPILAARELAKVEESISSDNNQSVDTLPPPATHGKPSSVATTDQDKMSTDDWVQQRREGKI